MLRSMYCAFRYGVYLKDAGGLETCWERRNSLVYYMELAFELAVSMIDFVHHVHMLVSWQHFSSLNDYLIDKFPISGIEHFYRSFVANQATRRHRKKLFMCV